MNKVLVVLGVLVVGFVAGILFRVEPTGAVAQGQGEGEAAGHAGDEFCLDANGDGQVDLSDPVFILGFLFRGNPASVDCSTPPHEAPHLRERIACLEADLAQCQTELARRGQLPATGQTKCYDAAGAEIPCDSATCTGQDGLYRAGCPSASRFADNGDGTMTDTCTGLMWQKDSADTSGDGSWTIEDYIPWCDALAYCESLDLAGHTDWRLPNVRELQSIADYGRCCSPDLTFDPVFLPSSADFATVYWSSTTDAGTPNRAWAGGFHGGTFTPTGKADVWYVRAVRRP
jgi:hypothetical protein